MNIDKIQAEARRIRELFDTGKEIITALKFYVTSGPMKDHLAVKAETEWSLTLSFYGLPLLFRIESDWPANAKPGDLNVRGRIAVCYRPYDSEPTEKLLQLTNPYPFDSLGNVVSLGGPHSKQEFSPFFLSDVLNAIQENKLTLRP